MTSLSVNVRRERPGDELQIREVTSRAFASSEFGDQGEARLIEELRAAKAVAVSLVAEYQNKIVGHILFSPATIKWSNQQSLGLGLAPMSVLPEFQRKGIGSQLIESGIEAVSPTDREFVIVLGHPDYYSKFGFTPASRQNICCQFEGVPDEAFLIRWFDEAPSTSERAVAEYHEVFSTFE